MTSKNNDLLIKASAAVAISHTLSLAQQQLWNFLLKSAYSELNTKEEHQIPMNILRIYFGNTKNDEYISQTLAGLGIKVHYNILGKDNINKWGFLNLLDYAEIENGVCTYAFSKKLRQLLHNPTFYTKINLLIQRKFYSKYALFLYELCIDYVGVKQTPWISLNKFRIFMGLQKDEYCEFKTLNSRVIKSSIKEINEKSDLFVDVNFEKENNKITNLKFMIEQKPHATSANQIGTEKQIAISVNEKKEIKENNVLNTSLKSLGLRQDKISELLNTYKPETISQKLALLDNNSSSIKNPSAWLITALKKDYKTVENYKEAQEAEKKRIIREKELQEKEKRELIDKLREQHQEYKEKLSLQRYEDLPTYMRTAFDVNYQNWIEQKNKENSYFNLVSQVDAKKLFLNETLLEQHEKEFIVWAAKQGYNIKKVNNRYEFEN